MLLRLIATLISTAIAIAIAAWILPGVDVDGGFWTYVWLAVIFGLVNAVLGPILRLLTLPFTIITLGLFLVVVNGLLFAITAWISDDIAVSAFGWDILAALIVSVVSCLFDGFFGLRTEAD